MGSVAVLVRLLGCSLLLFRSARSWSSRVLLLLGGVGWSLLSLAGFMVVSDWEEGNCVVVDCAVVEYWAVCGWLACGLLLLSFGWAGS